MTTRTPTLTAIVKQGAAVAVRDLWTSLPARVESYDAASKSATVQPLVYDHHADEAGDVEVERLPTIVRVPVMFPGSGAFRITFPVLPGDIVLVVCTSCALDRWKALGGEVDPEDPRRGDLTDAIAIPGLHHFADVPGGGPLFQITDAGEIHLGGTDKLATVAELNDLRGAYTSHAHPGNGSPPSPPDLRPTAYPGTSTLKGG